MDWHVNCCIQLKRKPFTGAGNMYTTTNDQTMSDRNDIVPIPGQNLFALLREDVGCVFQRDPAARTRWEVITTYPGIHALLSHRFAHALWKRNWHYAARFTSFPARISNPKKAATHAATTVILYRKESGQKTE